MLRELDLSRFLTATKPSTTVPISPYAPGMTTSKLNALMAEMDPEELQVIPRMVDVWLRVGWLEPDEAVEWQRRALVWTEFHGLTSTAERS